MEDGRTSPAPQRSAGARIAALVLLSGEARGTVYALAAEETLIGRNPSSDIRLDDDGASRQHAIVLRDASTGQIAIEDLQSTNGTKVNGKRVRSAVLEVGDEIQIGHSRFACTPDAGGAVEGPA